MILFGTKWRTIKHGHRSADIPVRSNVLRQAGCGIRGRCCLEVAADRNVRAPQAFERLMNREETIFEQALGTDSPAGREAYLRQACAGDEPMFERLQALLRVHDRAGKFLDPRPPAAEAASNHPFAPFVNTVTLPVAEKAGDRIGRYKLLQ